MVEPKQERAVQTRKAILSAAAEAFDEYGYAGASINLILKRAGLTTGALYFHFDSKEDLARAVMNEQPELIVPQLHSEGLQRLVDITLLWSHMLQIDPLLRAGVRLTGEQAAMGARDVTPYRSWAGVMTDCLRDAKESGELQAGVLPDELGEFITEACTGMQMYSAVASGREDLTERTLRMWRLLLPGVAVPAIISRTEITHERLKRLLG
ncbi:ScbR family autoregulator-binding transcription factor [Streptomyces sp. NPDC002795]|uniref:ScbR family autoregulator-binding transcription factor n=1 Tax=Streptomyces sp. NPDC002795 TaxID=3364665 RepID=UPI0036A6C00B